jgi:hypothetical protein
MLRHESLAPPEFTIDALRAIISHHSVCAYALGRFLGDDPNGPENGWDSDSYLDHDGFQCLLDGACEAARSFARNNNLFYNNERLADTVIDIMADAYVDGWNKVV